MRAIFKDGRLIARALAANVLVVPLLGVLLARLFALPEAIATGFLLMAIAPGVPFVLSSVRKRGGSLGLAVALALLLPLVSIVTVPITAALVLPPGAQAHVPLGRFAATLLIFQILPLCAGVLVTAKAPAFAMRLVRPLELLFFAAAVALLALISPEIVRDVTIGLRLPCLVGHALPRDALARGRLGDGRSGKREPARARDRDGASQRRPMRAHRNRELRQSADHRDGGDVPARSGRRHDGRGDVLHADGMRRANRATASR